MAALDDSPRPGKAPEITTDAKAWLLSLACQKVKDLGYPHKLWTTRLLARHARDHAEASGHPCMANIAKARWANPRP
nr:helix-turn-helix domain-containing protein [uncultured Rhodopila sp.]